MPIAHFSRFQHFSWLGFAFQVTPAMGNVCWNLKGTVHSLNVVFRGHGRVRWLCHGREVEYEATPGSMHFLPADGHSHTLLATAHEETSAYTLFVPKEHLDALAEEGLAADRVDFHRLFIKDDPLLYSCMSRLAGCPWQPDHPSGAGTEEAARRLVMRLAQLFGRTPPDWHHDSSVFDRKTLDHLLEYIDAHLTSAPSLSDMGSRVGLSPSHFGRKFRQSTGLSLQRCVNRRRIMKSMDLLKEQSQPISHLALDLGFTSQAHFTHVFSGLTGMTPAKYQRGFKRVVG